MAAGLIPEATVHCWQTPPLHDPPPQFWPHVPQFFGSEFRLVQAPLHAISPDGHEQLPFEQLPPVAQECPDRHEPQ